MHDVTYHTRVAWVPPSPLGLAGRRWAVWHHCLVCGREVTGDQLVAHAEGHLRAGCDPDDHDPRRGDRT